MKVSMGRSEFGSFRVDETTAVVGGNSGFISKPRSDGCAYEADMVDNVMDPFVEVSALVMASLVSELPFAEFRLNDGDDNLFLRHVDGLSNLRFGSLGLAWYKTPESVYKVMWISINSNRVSPELPATLIESILNGVNGGAAAAD